MHTADEIPVYDRGYEWWLMTEAKARNPKLKLYALPWAFPGCNGGSFMLEIVWYVMCCENYAGIGSNPYENVSVTADYVTKWVRGANSTYGLHIDYGIDVTCVVCCVV